jgi:hypothetical protein
VQTFSKQWKSLKCLPLEELESALAAEFKQAHGSDASTDGEGLTHLCSPGNSRTFQLPMAGSAHLRETTLLTEIYHMRSGVLIQKP